jgi:2,3-bisphosphoglycerate-dependent phosphoglycerate mutase
MNRAKKIHRVVFLRHGESTWNSENRFTGWQDVPLSHKGVLEAVEAGKMLRESGFTFDVAYTSLLQRAIKTYYTVAD